MRKILSICLALLLAAPPVQAQALFFGPPPPEKPAFHPDTSAVPLQSAAACYVTLSVIANGQFSDGTALQAWAPDERQEHYLTPLLLAYENALDAAMKASGQREVASQSPSEMFKTQIGEMRKQLAATTPDAGGPGVRAQVNICLTTIDASMRLLRANPAVFDALTCATVRNQVGESDGLFILPALYDASYIYNVARYIWTVQRERADAEVKAGLAGPNAATAKAQYADCVARNGGPLRAWIWNQRATAAPYVLSILNNRIFLRAEKDLANGGTHAEPELNDMKNVGSWALAPDTLKTWVGLPDADAPVICAAMEPYRGAAASPGQFTYMDIAIRKFRAGGIKANQTYAVIARVGDRYEAVFGLSGMKGVCQTWGEAEARKLGGTLIHVPAP